MNIIRLTSADVAASNHNVTKTTNSIFITCLPAHLRVCHFSPPAVFMLSHRNLEVCLSGSPWVHQTSWIIFNAESSEGSDMKEQIKAKKFEGWRKEFVNLSRTKEHSFRNTHMNTASDPQGLIWEHEGGEKSPSCSLHSVNRLITGCPASENVLKMTTALLTDFCTTLHNHFDWFRLKINVGSNQFKIKVVTCSTSSQIYVLIKSRRKFP